MAFKTVVLGKVPKTDTFGGHIPKEPRLMRNKPHSHTATWGAALKRADKTQHKHIQKKTCVNGEGGESRNNKKMNKVIAWTVNVLV